MNNKKSFNPILKKIILAVCLILVPISIGIIVFTNLNKSVTDPAFHRYNDFYKGNQAQISTPGSMADTETISMTAAAAANSNKGNVITIKNDTELNLFSSKCNSNAAFLGYSYKLIANIDYNNSNAFKPVGWNGTPFSGTFDGQGYEITGLNMRMTATTEFDGKMDYFSMFSVNSGTITNLGLTRPLLTTASSLDAFAGDGGVSYLVGKNTGTVSNSFIIDDDNALEQKAGIAANGGARIATLCVLNNGNLINNYVVTSAVVNISTKDWLEFSEISLKNEGSITNNYYYNASIQSYNGGVVEYKPAYNIKGKTGQTIGTYCKTPVELVNNLHTADNTWYIPADYGDISRYVGIDYAIRRGVAYDNDTKTITIANAKDFAYMYELFNEDDYMASNALTYNITADINLGLIPVESYIYKKGIGATIEGTDISGKPTLINTLTSAHPTIYNADVMNSARVVKSTGADCYGLFNYLTGTVKNLNIIPLEMDLKDVNTSNTSNVKAIGALSGYIEGGNVENVNVYATIKNSTNKNIGEFYLAGLCGILGGEAKIKGVTTAGSITLGSVATTIGSNASYMKGVAIGGVVGYIEASLGAMYTCLNGMNITCNVGANIDYTIGGVIGAGYTMNYGKDSNDEAIGTSMLENVGNITVANSTNKTYKTLYVAGIIGRHYGVIDQVNQFTNNGDVTVYSNGNETYVAGIENADILTAKKDGTGLTASQFKNNAGNSLFYASAFANGGNITVTGDGNNLVYSNVLNIKATNNLRSKLSSLTNLQYTYKYNNASSKVYNKYTAQEISANSVYTFASVLTVTGDKSNYNTELHDAYNLRDINIKTSATLEKDLNYNGVAYGNNISYDNVYNEGNIKLEVSHAIKGNISINGVFNELSDNSKAQIIYNNGNIEVDFKADITGNVNASGICYAIRNGITNIDEYNPSKDTYNKNLAGALNSVVNNGDVKVSSSSFTNIEYKADHYYWYRNTETTKVGQTSIMGSVVAAVLETSNTNPVYRVKGNINASGIVNVNESVISNTFNLGNVKALNYIIETTKRQVNVGGIATLNVGKYAYIINSANNGDITGANLASYNYGVTGTGQYGSDNNTTAPKKVVPDNITYYKSDVTVGGIVSRNDKLENGNDYINTNGTITNHHSSQLISFTINYGSIYAYNYAEIGTAAIVETKCKAAAIIGSGLCNVINVNNYGSVYSGDVAAGIFGLISLTNYKSEVDANKIYIANTINYGNIYSLKHAYDEYKLAISTFTSTTSEDNVHPKYSDFNSDNLASFGFVSKNINTKFKYYTGSVIGIIDFGNNANAATNIIVRYLVSFNENVSISGAEINVNKDVDADTSTIYSPHLKPDVDGFKDRDDYLATNVQFAPLSSEKYTANFLTTNTVSGGHPSMTFYGVFNSNFKFREVIEGKIKDGENDYYNTSKYATDRFLTDFFQFVPYSYINDYLMETIGWKTGAYLDAANKFANSLEGTYLLYKNAISDTTYQTDKTKALSTNTWSEFADPEILSQLVDKLFGANSDKDAVLSYLEYVFGQSTTDNPNASIFTDTLRGSIIEYVYKNYSDSINTNDLLNFANGYSTILANALCVNASNEVKTSVINHINTYITGANGVTREELLLGFIDYLKENGDSFFKGTSKTTRYDLLLDLFNSIENESSFFKTLLSLFSDANQDIINGKDVTDNGTDITDLSNYSTFKKLSNENKIVFFQNVINAYYNTNGNTPQYISTYLDSFYSEIGLFDYLRKDGYDKLSFDDINNSIDTTSTTNEDDATIDERVALWNQIRNTNTFKTWFNSVAPGASYYLATEYNNTYQTDSAPIPYGLEGDEAFAKFNDTDNPNDLGKTSDINFIYTTNVTPNTYFYGPYASPVDGYVKVDTVTVESSDYNRIYYLTDGGNNYIDTGSYTADIPVGATCYYYRNRWRSLTTYLSGTYYIKNSNGTYSTAPSTYNSSTTYYIKTNRNTLIPTGDGTSLSTTAQGTINKNTTVISSNWWLNTSNSGWYSVIFTDGTTNPTSVTTGKDTGIKGNTSPLTIRKRINKPYYDNSSTKSGININLYYMTKKTDDYVIVNGIKQTLNNVELRREAADNTNHDYILGNTEIYCTKRGDKFTIYNADGTKKYEDQTNWDNLLKDYVYTATVRTASADWYTSSNTADDGTGRTGIYVKFYSNGTQIQIKYGENSMFTTRYIDYSPTQLLAVDGYLTKYTDNPKYESKDERDIINSIFNTILLTSGNIDAFKKVVAKSIFESAGSNSSNSKTLANHIDFIDNFVANGLTTSTPVDSKAPFDYLYYSYVSTTNNQTINEYLTPTSFNDNKKKILNAAASNRSVFAELMEILFNKSLVLNADTDWDPDLGYGSSLDMKALYEKVGNTGVATGNAFPIIAKSSETVTPTNASVTIQNYDGNNPKTINTVNTQEAASNNIGYFVGESTKMYKKSSKNYSFDNFYYPQNSNYDYKLPFTESDGTVHNAPSDDVVKYLKDNYSTDIYGARLNAAPDLNNVRAIEDAIVSGVKGTAIAPERCIWIAPVQAGIIKLVVVNFDNTAMGFQLMKITRRKVSKDTPRFATGFSSMSVDAVLSTNGSGDLKEGKFYYFEYKVTQEMVDNGYEFCLSKGNGSNSAYFCYIDFGVSAQTKDLTPEKTYYIQDKLNHSNDNLNKIITYLTPLDAKNIAFSYIQATNVDQTKIGNYYTYSKATTYNATTKYYAVDSNGHYVIAHGVTEDNVTDYYVFEQATSYDESVKYYDKHLIGEYHNQIFNDPDFIKALAKSSNKATYTLIKSINSKEAYINVLKELVKLDSRNFDSIINYAKTNSLITSDYEYYLTGGALATDYYRNYKTDITKTHLKKLLDGLSTDYQYINITGAQPVDSGKFEELCEHIGYPLDMNYGIFALASNEGIKNGVFIPDNLALSSMDSYYTYNTTEEVYEMSPTKTAYWRLAGSTEYDKASKSGYTGDNAVTYKESVNYGFYIEMKQIKKSIATTIFELNITDGTNTYFGDVNLSDNTITFYSSSDTISGNFTINKLVKADNTTSDKASGDLLTSVSAYNTVFDNITITAQEQTITKTYKLQFKKLDVSYTLKYDTKTSSTESSKTITSTDDTTLIINLTAEDDKKLPAGLNLEPYIKFIGEKKTYDMSSDFLTISADSTDHRIKSDGSAVITIVVSHKLPADTYNITIAIGNESESVTCIKEASTKNEILSMVLNGQNIIPSANMTSTIPFGRAYDYTDLTDPNSENFYLYNFEISTNATAVITATNEILSDGLMKYVVTFKITSESGVEGTYTHTLTEKQFFNENDTYANIYADGEEVLETPAANESERPYHLSAGTLKYSHNDDTYSLDHWSLEDGMKSQVSFNRKDTTGMVIEPQYRIKYNLANFYTLGKNVEWAPTSDTLTNGATVNNTYAGLTVTVSENNDTGKYVFVYTYKNTGTWENDVEYERYYEFPEFVIEKLASTDALLHQLTFLEEYVMLGNTATVIYPEIVVIPDKSGASTTYESTDILYKTAFEATSRDIVVTSRDIKYNNGSDNSSNSDYYAIGTVSDADLSFYCPTFKVDEYAQMYQYTTLSKLTEYGLGQTKTDAEILSTHTNMYLYVPFNNGTKDEVLLVEIDSSGYWTNIYKTTFNGTNGDTTKVGEFTAGITSKNAKGVTVGDYTVCDYAGSATDNQSLFMDYIGTPLNGHFWYVSYVIFSEDKLLNGVDDGNVRYYHISIIDTTNTIQFNVTIYADPSLNLNDIYLTISENIYKDKNNTLTYQSTRQISAYGIDSKEAYSGSRTDIADYKIYTLKYALQTVPKGYFYFYVDLPDGYKALAYTDMANQLNITKTPDKDEKGSFLPFTSIITQKVALEIDIHKGSGDEAGAWAISTTDIYTRNATYSGQIPQE